MKTLVFKDPMLNHRTAVCRVNVFILGVIAANGGAINNIIWGPGSDDCATTHLTIQCPNKYSKMLIDGITETLIEARLSIVVESLLESLAWKFSSPALTTAFRDIIVPVSPGTTHSPRMKT